MTLLTVVKVPCHRSGRFGISCSPSGSYLSAHLVTISRGPHPSCLTTLAFPFYVSLPFYFGPPYTVPPSDAPSDSGKRRLGWQIIPTVRNGSETNAPKKKSTKAIKKMVG